MRDMEDEELKTQWETCLQLKGEYLDLMERRRLLLERWRSEEKQLLETLRESLHPILLEWGLMVGFAVARSNKAFIDNSRLPEGRPLYYLCHPPEKFRGRNPRRMRHFGLLGYLLPTHEEILYHLLENCPEDILAKGVYIGGIPDPGDRASFLWMYEDGTTSLMTEGGELGRTIWGPMTPALSEAILTAEAPLQEILFCIPRYEVATSYPLFVV